MTTRVTNSAFVCYCKIMTDSVIEEYDPYATTGVVKKLFKKSLTTERVPNNIISNNTILGATIFRLDLMNVILDNDVFLLKSIPESTESDLETFLYTAINDFRFGDKASFEVRLETLTDDNDYSSPRIRIIYNRNNTIEEIYIPLLEVY